MGKVLLLCVFFLFSLLQEGLFSIASEEWGYVEVRPKAHMFWWHYRSPKRVENHPTKPWPIILWLQGGPGASGVGIGNFEEVGPLDSNLKPRNSTWLQVADLLFVDSPVGTGYSYVEKMNLLVKNDEEAAKDLTVLLQKLFNNNKFLQLSPLYIVAESYGGKFAVTLALSALKAIQSGNLKLKLGGVALGDSWISPEDFVLSWGPLLKDMSRLDSNGLKTANRISQKIKEQIKAGLYLNATNSWSELEEVISQKSNNVDFYNFLLDLGEDAPSSADSKITAVKKYSAYLDSLRSINPSGADNNYKDNLMDVIIRKKLKIIPENILWGGQSENVFQAMAADFMKPRINEVDELLAKGVNVTIYNGQLDLICSTRGAEAWIEKLRWKGIQNFLRKDRNPLFCGQNKHTRGFIKSYQNLKIFWILGAGHFVPVDQPCIALRMVHAITQSPAKLDCSDYEMDLGPFIDGGVCLADDVISSPPHPVALLSYEELREHTGREFAKKALIFYESQEGQGAKFEVVQPLYYKIATLGIRGTGSKYRQSWCHVSFTAQPKNSDCSDGTLKFFFAEGLADQLSMFIPVHCSTFQPSGDEGSTSESSGDEGFNNHGCEI